jgi:hypothetical protein
MKKSLLKNYYSVERIIGIIMMLIAIIGLYDTVFGDWSSGPGYGTTFFPQLAFLLLFGMGLSFQFYFKDNKTKLIDWLDVKTILLLIGTGAIYFKLVRTLGLITSSFLYCSFLIAVLTNKPLKNMKSVLIPGLIGTVIIWLLFTKLVSLVLPRTLLF